jgi:hypothetical protein
MAQDCWEELAQKKAEGEIHSDLPVCRVFEVLV